MFTKKIPLIFVFISLLFGGIATYVIMYSYTSFQEKKKQQKNEISIKDTTNLNVFRLNGSFHYIKPILYAEEKYESVKYSPLKADINKIIELNKADGTLNTISVYLRSFKKGEWMSINPQEVYQPGSLLKVPILMTYLKMDEKDKNVLNSFIICDKINTTSIKQNIAAKSIKVGKKYKVKELLHYMITYSDNNATSLLLKYIDADMYKKVFTDLQLDISKMDNREEFHLSARQYSLFFNVLFSATYLDNSDSELAAELLCESDFKDGIIKELPKNVKVAHKFGEAGTNDMHELSETGIIYLADNPYLLTIMTKGRQLDKLSPVISNISKLVFDKMSSVNE